MMLPSQGMKVYLALGNTDMRKSINGLSILVESNMDLDPFFRAPVCILQSPAEHIKDIILGLERFLFMA